MEWKIEYNNKDWLTLEWVEKHNTNRLSIELLKYKKEYRNENEGYTYLVECFGTDENLVSDLVIPENTEIATNYHFGVLTQDLSIALEVIEELKEKYEKALIKS